MDEYDISDIFKDMEDYLISSMSRNLGKHTAWEEKEGFKWDTWQSKQLEALAEFRKNNSQYVKGQTKDIKSKLSSLINQSNEHGQLEEEIKILSAIKSGYKGRKVEKGLESTFFKINDRKLKSLIKATNGDLEKATTAALRMTNDQYRQTIYKAQVFANTGTITINQAIDMATKDFLSRGINCIEYSNGRRVGIDTYSEMAIRNANKKAYLQGEGVKRQEYGIVTVLVSRYGACSETCLPYQGKVYIDDVWSGGTTEDSERLGYPLLSKAIAGGLFHPNCKHTLSTYFEGLTTIPTAREVAKTRENSDLVATQRYNERNIRKYKRLENNSLDEENKAYYGQYKNKWLARQRELLNNHPEMNRNRAREAVRVNSIFDSFGNGTTYVEDKVIKFSNRSLKENDGTPGVFNYSTEKDNNLFSIFIDIDTNYKNDGFEWMGIADSNTGKLLHPIHTSSQRSHVDPSSKMIDIIDSASTDSITTIHNHPKKTTFSYGDVITTNNVDSIKESIVINSDGEAYFLSIPKDAKMRLDREENIQLFKKYIKKKRMYIASKHPNYSINEINHVAWIEIAEDWGWLYGRKRI